jgi:DNA-binding NtrC family response regulator
VRPVGGTVERAVDVRILCASKQDLRAMVERDEFLEDLYYRMLDFPVHVPPLRERPEDVLLLAEHFIAQTCAELGRPLPTMTRSFAECLRAYAWPGNVRELEKAIRRTVILAAGELQLRMVHLPPRLREDALGSEAEDGASSEAGGPLPLRAQVAELERRVLAEALAITGWNRAEVSRRLCISYPTLLQKIKLYGLHAPA